MDQVEQGRLLASDVGGTFTDLVLLDEASGHVRVEKVPTTPHDPSQGVVRGVDQLSMTLDGDPLNVRHAVHATTLVANTIVERAGAVTALLVTEGFRDLLRLRRHTRAGTFDLYLDPPAPLVSREHVYSVPERILATGKVWRELDEEAVRDVARRMKADGIEAAAIVLLHSYVNPSHEERVAELLSEALPEVKLTLSSDLVRRSMEYERASTTVASAYCTTKVGDYFQRLETSLSDRGVRGALSVMTSSGGVTSVASAVRAPVRLVESGPSAGATYVARLGHELEIDDLLAFDMGGTTAKGCLIRGGVLPLADGLEVARSDSYRPGSGFPIQVPTVNLIEIGSGGGSIASIDAVGLLRVGPQSAGAVPGPACYQRGGESATVTDADLVLGRLSADNFVGGEMPLSISNAEHALAALRPGNSVVENARLVQDVVTENMAAAILRHVIERGGDPSQLTMVAFGGAGPVHAHAVARRMGVKRVLVPPMAGVLSAVGLLVANPSFQITRTVQVPVSELHGGDLESVFSELKQEVTDVLSTIQQHVSPRFKFLLNCAYHSQSSTLPIEILESTSTDGAEVFAAFESAHKSAYGYAHVGVPVEVSSIMVEGSLSGGLSSLPMDPRPGRADVEPRYREAWSRVTGGMVSHSVHWRRSLPAEQWMEGPAIVEERESTTVVDVGSRFRIDRLGNIEIEIG